MTRTDTDMSPVAATLAASPHHELHRIDVFESEFTVEIVGTVDTYFLKQLAQETIRPLLAERRLINRVSVIDRPIPPKG